MAMKRKNVLWIDDEVEFLRSHIMFLETRGYRVTPVFSGDDGLQKLREEPDAFDIVLLDEQMPGKDGLTVLVEIKDMLPDLPVVMVTKSEEEELMEKAIGRKIDGYLTKPVNPSQVLIVCKNLLHSSEIVSEQAKGLFVKSYSEIQTQLKREQDYKGWVKIYHGLIKREISLEDIDDESIRQGHSSQKNEANIQFGDFMISHYPKWMNNEEEKPTLSNDILSKFLVPEINSGKKVAFLVMDSIRLDQYIMIQRVLKRNFQASNYFYYSMLPSSKRFALSALLSGMTPLQIKKQQSNLWDIVAKGGSVWQELLKVGFENNDLDPKKVAFFDMQNSRLNINKIADSIVKKDSCAAIHADFIELFGGRKNSSDALGEMAANGKAFRKMTSAWFEESRLYELLRRLSSEEVTVVMTPSSGNILCTRGTEYYGLGERFHNGRFRYGDDITCDERFGYLLTEPERYGLPVDTENSQYVVLKENFHFKDHSTYQEYNNHYKNTFERGGVSLDEMILPLTILKPKVLDLDLDL